MRTLTVYQVRPHVDDMVDRPEVEVWQHMELTGTNRPRTCLLY